MGSVWGSRFLALALGFAPALSFAAPTFEQVRGLAGRGWDVAQYRKALADSDPAAAYRAARGNWLVADLNQDGLSDLVAIYEANPRLENDHGVPCAQVNYETNCFWRYGAREMRVYLGRGGDVLSLISVNRTVLTAEDGGVWGDPLEGLTVNSRGSVVLNVYGGSNWRWWRRHTFQWRDADLYLVGLTDGFVFIVDGQSKDTDSNFLTRRQKTTTVESFEGRAVETWKDLAPAPLKAIGSVDLGLDNEASSTP